jgi:hypothetical protein
MWVLRRLSSRLSFPYPSLQPPLAPPRPPPWLHTLGPFSHAYRRDVMAASSEASSHIDRWREAMVTYNDRGRRRSSESLEGGDGRAANIVPLEISGIIPCQRRAGHPHLGGYNLLC